MNPKDPTDRRRVDTSTPVVLDLSPEIIAERVRKLGIMRRTAKAALAVRETLKNRDGKPKP